MKAKTRMYQTSMFGKVDLNDPKTYDYLPKTWKELEFIMFKEIGYAICYMDFFPSRKGLFPKRKRKPDMVKMSDVFGPKYSDKLIDLNNSCWEQRQRVYKLIEEFTKERKNNYGNVAWWREQVFLFQDETENMC